MRIAAMTLVFCLLFEHASFASVELTVAVSAKHSVYFAGQDPDFLSQLSDFLSGNAADYPGLDGLVSPPFLVDLKTPGTIPTPIDIRQFGGQIDIEAKGIWAHGNPSRFSSGPEGRGEFLPSSLQHESLGVSILGADLNMLAGVFLGDTKPQIPAPPGLSLGNDMTRPEIGQSFAIGASLDNIIVPDNATRLFLGLHDGDEWNNNVGSIEATIKAVPEPATIVTWATLMGLLISIAWLPPRFTD